MRLLARAGPGPRPHPGTRSALSGSGKSHKGWRPGPGRRPRSAGAERRLFVEEDQDGDHRPTHHVLNRTGRVVTVTGGQCDDDDEVVDTGLGRAGRGELEPVFKTKRSSVLSFGDLHSVIR